VYSPAASSPFEVHGNRHKLIAAGPVPQAPMGGQDNNQVYSCVYDNEINDREQDIIIVATAICFDVQP
jgi:hypothetical protein